jgi:TatD DNase family protein
VSLALPRPGWTDSHCHLPEDPEAAAALVAEAAEAGVDRLIDVGTDVASSQAAQRRAATYGPVVWATAGLHPHDAKDGGLDAIEALLAQPGVVAVGECGLDYHYDHSPRPVQREVFAAQIRLARRSGKALVIHTRAAWDDTFAVLAAEGVPERTVFHCFSGGPEEAARCLELGASLSLSGIVTFPKAPELREVAKLVPLDRLLVETDSPYLAPVPHRGKRNQPAWVAVVGAAVADARGMEPAEVAAATSANATALYRLPS